MNLPNLITILRIVFIPLLIVSLFKFDPGISLAIFLAIALSDILDGFLARSLKCESSLGKFLDPLADKLLVISCLAAFAIKSAAPISAVLLIAGREILITGYRMAKSKKNQIIAADSWGKIKTFLQVLAISAYILNLVFAATLLWIACIVTLASGAEIILKAEKNG